MMTAPAVLPASWRGLTQEQIYQKLRSAPPEVLTTLEALLPLTDRPPSFAAFAQSTLPFPLHEWQERHLCPLIQRLADERGVRALIHAAPQYGKSVLLSQRAPAYLLGRDPLHRVGLACYNETHAGGFGAVVRNLMQSPDYREMFPDPRCRLKRDAAEGEFSTAGRRDRNDGQPSFLAMGLLSGFTGKSVDTLILDDPYRSAEDARSEIINDKVWRFWKDTARPRIGATANVIVMFHRYTESDLAGRLLEEGGWEYYRFPAIADANEDGSDPTGRALGELLSPLRSREWLEEQETGNPLTFLGQFQGRPTTPEGLFFQVGRLATVGAVPAGARRVRYWDLAGAAPGRGDWTCGCLLAATPDGRYVVEHVRRGQWPAAERTGIIRQTCEQDRARYGSVSTYVEQAPGLAKEPTEDLIRALAGFNVAADLAHRDKVSRAEPVAAQVNAGNVSLLQDTEGDRWHARFLDELRVFPNGKWDDQVDASSGAFGKLTMGTGFLAASYSGADRAY